MTRALKYIMNEWIKGFSDPRNSKSLSRCLCLYCCVCFISAASNTMNKSVNIGLQADHLLNKVQQQHLNHPLPINFSSSKCNVAILIKIIMFLISHDNIQEKAVACLFSMTYAAQYRGLWTAYCSGRHYYLQINYRYIFKLIEIRNGV